MLRAKVVVAWHRRIGATTVTFVATGGLLPLAHDLVVCGIVKNCVDIP